MIEVKDDASGGGDNTLKQYVRGQSYVDEIVEIAVNGDPTTPPWLVEGLGYWEISHEEASVLVHPATDCRL
jgi:hypothetical protein